MTFVKVPVLKLEVNGEHRCTDESLAYDCPFLDIAFSNGGQGFGLNYYCDFIHPENSEPPKQLEFDGKRPIPHKNCPLKETP